VRENLDFFTRLMGSSPAAYRERHDRLLERLNLAGKEDTVVRELSRGMKQKVSIASALAREPDLLFLDEPTLGLDVESSLELRAEIARLVEETEMTVVLSSHDMDVIEELCDRVVILNEGRVLRDGTTDDLLAEVRSEAVRLTLPLDAGAAVDGLDERFEVTSRERRADRDELVVEVTLPSWNALGDLITAFETAGVRLHGVETMDPDFEDAFLQITGRQRDV
jgi:ABC-2 type transport system ATP-binding protein